MLTVLICVLDTGAVFATTMPERTTALPSTVARADRSAVATSSRRSGRPSLKSVTSLATAPAVSLHCHVTALLMVETSIVGVAGRGSVVAASIPI